MNLTARRQFLSFDTFASFTIIAVENGAGRVSFEARREAVIPRRGKGGGIGATAQTISAGAALADRGTGVGHRVLTRQMRQE